MADHTPSQDGTQSVPEQDSGEKDHLLLICTEGNRQLNPGDHLGQNNEYILTRLLGEGAYSAVWGATDRRSQTEVAIKVFRPRNFPDVSDRMQAALRFWDGVAAMRRLHGEAGIVPGIDVRPCDRCRIVKIQRPGDYSRAPTCRRVGGEIGQGAVINTGRVRCRADVSALIQLPVAGF